MSNSAEFKKLLDSTKPEIEKLIRKVDEKTNTYITGFVFKHDPPTFIKFGNVENRGDDIIKLYIGLSKLAAEVDSGAQFTDISFEELKGDSVIEAGDTPENIADALAKQVLVTAMEPAHAANAVHLAQRYLASRRPINGNEK